MRPRAGAAARVLAAGGTVLALLLLGACGSGSDPRATEPATTGVAADAPAPASVRVGLIEWTIETSSPRARPGRLRLRVTNAGATEHGLAVHGRLGSWRTRTLLPGERTTLVVRAAPGETLALSSSQPGQVHPMHARLAIGR